MAKAWKKIKGFFRGGESARGPEATDLYGGPSADWNASFNADGTISGTPGTAATTTTTPTSRQARQAGAAWSRYTGRKDPVPESTTTTTPGRAAGVVPLSAQVRGNQTGTQAAMNALANTQRIANTGWTSQDRAAMGAADRASQRSAQAAIGALAQQGRARGTGGGGQTFAAMAGAAQQAANASADRGASIAQMGAERRAQASQALAGMGLGMDSQAFGQNMQRAGAVDEFNRYATGANANALQQAYQNRRQYQEDENARRERMMNNINQMSATGMSIFGDD